MDEILELQKQINILSRKIEDLETRDIPINIPKTTFSPSATGWSSTTESNTFYKQNGSLVYVQWRISGTSNSVLTNITVPVAKINSGGTLVSYSLNRDNGTWYAGYCTLGNGGTQLTFVRQPGDASNSWTNTGTKSIYGYILYEAST